MWYEWDPDKARANSLKHGVEFSDAILVLEDDHARTIRDASGEQEERWVTMGMDALGKVLVVVYTWRGAGLRIISARRATRRERRQYEKER